MAYQTNSREFFDYLNQLLLEKKVNDTIEILSDASSADPTLNGDLKFLKLRVNKKLMVPVGSTSAPSAEHIRDLGKLINEMKNAHSRRNVIVSTLKSPSNTPAKNNITSPAYATASTPKKRRVWPWLLLVLLLGGSAGAYFFKDKILANEFVQNILPEGFLSDASSEKTPVITASNDSTSKANKSKKTTSSKKKSTTRSSKTLGRYYIQIASYAKLDQALSKRKRVEMSFDRAIILQKKSSNASNYRVVIPGFSSKNNAEKFKKDRKVNNLHVGAFTRAFSNDCKNLEESDSNIYVCE